MNVRNRLALFCILGSVLLGMSAVPLQATDFLPISLKDLVARADVIVIGEIRAIQDIPAIGTKRGKLQVADVIRSNRPIGDELLIGWFGEIRQEMANGAVSVISGALHMSVGASGIWILNYKQDGLYHITHPSGWLRNLGEEATVRNLAALAGKVAPQTLNGLTATLSLSKEVYEPGEPVTATVTVTNVSNRVIALQDRHGEWERFQMELIGPDDQPIASPVAQKKSRLETITLLPGAAYSRNLKITQRHNPLSVGEYSLAITYHAEDLQLAIKSHPSVWTGTVQTQTIDLIVKAPQKEVIPEVTLSASATLTGLVRILENKKKIARFESGKIEVVVKNGSKEPFALTLEALQVGQGNRSYSFDSDNLDSKLPELITPGTEITIPIALPKSVVPLDSLNRPVDCRMIFSDFSGNRFEVHARVESKPLK